jgi:hypothetical protein
MQKAKKQQVVVNKSYNGGSFLQNLKVKPDDQDEGVPQSYRQPKNQPPVKEQTSKRSKSTIGPA